MRAKLSAKNFVKLLALPVLISLTLLGCSSTPYRNSSAEQGTNWETVQSSLDQLPGIEKTDFYSEPYSNPGKGGLGAVYGVNFQFALVFKPDYRVVNPKEFLQRLGDLVWNIDDGFSPSRGFELTIAGGVDANFNWYETVNELYGQQQSKSTSLRLYVDQFLFNNQKVVKFSLGNAVVEGVHGKWNSKSPDVQNLASQIAQGTPTKIETVPAIYSLSAPTGYSTSGGVYYYSFSARLGENYYQDQYYNGTVNYKIYQSGKLIKEDSIDLSDANEKSTPLVDDQRSVSFTIEFDHQVAAATLSIEISAEAVPGFSSVSLQK